MESRFSPRIIAYGVVVIAALGAAVYVAGDHGSQTKRTRSSRVHSPATSADPFLVPDGTTEELVQFLRSLRPYRAEDAPTAPPPAQQQRLAAALIEAGERIQSQHPGGSAEIVAVKARLEGLRMQAEGQSGEAAQQLEQAIAEYLASPQPQIVDEAKLHRLQMQSDALKPGEDAQAETLIQDLGDLLERRPDGRRLIETCKNTALMLGQFGQTNLAERAFERFCPLVRSAAERQAGRLAEKTIKTADEMQDNLDKLKLVGQRMEVKGTTVAGEEIRDPFLGKIVLVDFWASWCGPCFQDMPHVQRCYDEYHERGFEVIGVCMDDFDDIDKIPDIVQKLKMPWPVLIGTSAATSGPHLPLAAEYGVRFLPAGFLLDREGKIVTPLARGATLHHLLERMLAEPVAPQEPPQGKE